MAKVRFLEPVYFEGKTYAAGQEYALDEQSVQALGNSVEVMSREEESKDATVQLPRLSVKDMQPQKDKMIKKADQTK